jgi:hypothetical protein
MHKRTLLLITASSPEIQRVRRARVLNFQQITIPYLAAFVPPHWQVIHIDEAVMPVDTGMKVDLVGITFHTPSAPHVYALSAQFRQRGIPVALGGPHVTLLPDEAREHADVIFVPRQMSPETLLEGYRYANRRFYSPSSIYQRLSHSPVGLRWTLPLNLAYLFALRFC